MKLNEYGKFEIPPVVGLDEVNPLWDLHLARPEDVVIHSLWGHEAMIVLFIGRKIMVYLLLEEGCKGHGELLLANILNGNRRHLL